MVVPTDPGLTARRRRLLLLTIAAAIPRLAAIAVWPSPEHTLYFELASALVRDGRYLLDGVAATQIEPLYPLALAGGLLITGGRTLPLLVLQVVVCAAGAPLIYSITARTMREARAGWIAVALYGCSPYLIRQSVAFMEVSAAVLLLLAAIRVLQAPQTVAASAAFGALLGSLVLTRFSFLPIAAAGLAILFVRRPRGHAVAALLACLLCLAPWIAYTRTVDGSWLPSRVGENLYVSTGDAYWRTGPRVNVDVQVPQADDDARQLLASRGVLEYDNHQRDNALLELAGGYARQHPARTVALKLRNLAYAVQPRLLPFAYKSGETRPLAVDLAAGTFQLLLLMGGAGGLWLRRAHAPGDAFLLAIIASVLGVNVMFYPTSRLLAPLTPVLMIYAGRLARR